MLDYVRVINFRIIIISIIIILLVEVKAHTCPIRFTTVRSRS